MGTSEHAATRVLVVDDHEMFVDSLVRLLSDERDFEVVGVAHTVRDAVRTAAQLRPDVVLLDFALPDGDAPACMQALKGATPGTPVLVMTGLGDDATVLAARDAGCAGVVTKDRAARELVAALRAVATGSFGVGDERLRTVAMPRSRWDFADRALSRREIDVLVLISHGRSTEQIAHDLHVSVNTVRNHAHRILTKLGTHSRLEAVNEAVRRRIIAPPG